MDRLFRSWIRKW